MTGGGQTATFNSTSQFIPGTESVGHLKKTHPRGGSLETKYSIRKYRLSLFLDGYLINIVSMCDVQTKFPLIQIRGVTVDH